MISKGTKLYSVLHQKCPQCQEGNMFKHSSFSLKFGEMHKNCPVCGFDFIQEPSFYFGAMYFSYAILVAIFIVVYFILRYTINPSEWTYLIWMIICAFAIMPLNFRWSRLAWINLFAKYKPNHTSKV